eukprot:TRINITY_DN6354_c0_g1_i11.p1 TRINITY_DN6354_c0_g1~~TRINITY_DN6354_c0_g1_i11.p1  ORF type:complete len:1799 (-),score=420.90 TRINITY_DN6354_c0_g1_i11:4242-9275(-)
MEVDVTLAVLNFLKRFICYVCDVVHNATSTATPASAASDEATPHRIISISQPVSALHELIDTLSLVFNNEKLFHMSKYTPDQLTPAAEDDCALRPASSQGSALMAELLNLFGRRGGFELLFAHARLDHPLCSILEVKSIVEFINAVNKGHYFTTPCLNAVTDGLEAIVVPRLTELSPEEMATVGRDDLEKLFYLLSFVLDTASHPAQSAETLECAYLRVAQCCIDSGVSDKQAYGVQCVASLLRVLAKITEQAIGGTGLAVSCDAIPFRNVRWLTAPRLARWLADTSLLDHILRLRAPHADVPRRLPDVLRFAAAYKVIAPCHVTLVWSLVSEPQSRWLLEGLEEAASYLQAEHIEGFINAAKEVPHNLFTCNQVLLLHKLSNKCTELAHKAAILEFLWDLALAEGSSAPPRTIACQIVSCLQDSSKAHIFRSYRADWFDRIFKALKVGRSVCFCYNMITAILGTYPKRYSPQDYATDVEYATTVATQLVEKRHLLDLFFDDFVKFHEAAEQTAAALQLDDSHELMTLELAGRMDYRTELVARLNFLRTLLPELTALAPVNETHYETLWNYMVNRALCTAESDEFFQWLVSGRIPDAGRLVILDHFMKSIYRGVMLSAMAQHASEGAKGLSEAAMNCFIAWFCDYNTSQNLMAWSADKPQNFEVHTCVSTLHGYRQLWDIALASTSSPDAEVLCVRFLRQLHLTSKVNANEDFVKSSMAVLEQERIAYADAPSAVAADRLRRCVLVIREFTEQSDRTRHYTPHGERPARALTIDVTSHLEPSLCFTLRLPACAPINYLRAAVRERLVAAGRAAASGEVRLSTEDGCCTLAAEDGSLPLSRVFVHARCQGVGAYVQVGVSYTERFPGRETFNRPRLPAFTHTFCSSQVQYQPPDVEYRLAALATIHDTTPRDVALTALRRANFDVAAATAALAAHKLELVDDGDQLRQQCGWLLAGPPYFATLFGLLDGPPALAGAVWDLLQLLPTGRDLRAAIASALPAVLAAECPVFTASAAPPYRLLYNLQTAEGALVEDGTYGLADALVAAGALGALAACCSTVAAAALPTSAHRRCLALAAKCASLLARRAPAALNSAGGLCDALATAAGAQLRSVAVEEDDDAQDEVAEGACALLEAIAEMPNGGFDPRTLPLEQVVLADDDALRWRLARGLAQLAARNAGAALDRLLPLLPRACSTGSGGAAYFALLATLGPAAPAGPAGALAVALSRTLTELMTVGHAEDSGVSIAGPADAMCALLSARPELRGEVRAEALAPALCVALGFGPGECLCKTPLARSAVSRLLVELSTQLTPSDLVCRLLPPCTQPLHVARWAERSCLGPTREPIAPCGRVGLVNSISGDGVESCYDAVLQELFMAKAFVRKVYDAPVPRDTPLLYQLQLLFANLQLSKRRAYDCTPLVSACSGAAGNQSRHPHEVLNTLCRVLEGAAPGTCTPLSCTVVCTTTPINEQYPHATAITETHHSLTLETKNRKNLLDALDAYFNDPREYHTYSEAYDAEVIARHRSCMQTLPRVLALGLIRFERDYTATRSADPSRRDVKLNVHLPFPVSLDLRRYASASLLEARGLEPASCAPFEYVLVGAVVADGPADMLRYRALAVDRGSGKWFSFNGDAVTPVDNIEAVLHESYGPPESAARHEDWPVACLLLYEQKFWVCFFTGSSGHK